MRHRHAIRLAGAIVACALAPGIVTGQVLPAGGHPATDRTDLTRWGPKFDVREPYHPVQLPTVVEAYSRALDHLSSTTGPAPIERLYSLGMQVRDSLLSGENGAALLEDMDESTYVAVRRRMKGFWLEREVFEAVVPQASFFLPLARSRGGPADTAFFAALRSTYGDEGAWPAYLQPVTDESGCTDFGTGELVKAYRVWSRFAARYPGRYSSWVREEVEHVEQELVQSTCACGDSASVLRELRMYLRRFPSSDLSPAVKGRLEQVEKDHAAMRYHCRPG